MAHLDERVEEEPREIPVEINDGTRFPGVHAVPKKDLRTELS